MGSKSKGLYNHQFQIYFIWYIITIEIEMNKGTITISKPIWITLEINSYIQFNNNKL